MKEKETKTGVGETLYDPKAAEVVLNGLATLSKEVKQSAISLDDTQIKIILDNYYKTQEYRKYLANQVRAAKEILPIDNKSLLAVSWLLADIENREEQIKKLIAQYVKNNPVCEWASWTKGIGPVFAANLYSYLDLSKCTHANQFIAYCGLNNNNAPWLGTAKSTEIVNEAYKHFGLSAKDPADERVILRVAMAAGRSVISVRRGFENHKKKQKKKISDKNALMGYMAKPPYNRDLQKICFLIGESFTKVSNRDSLYGRLYKERKAWEEMQNENLAYAEQAEKMLKEYNYGKDTETFKYLSKGKLSPAHINRRAQRYATKIFLTHFFEACYIHKYQKEPPVIYPIAHLGHADYIKPEVPYKQLWRK